jgi:hypothetical protein
MTTHIDLIRSPARFLGSDVVTRFMARDEDDAAVLDTDIERIDVIAIRRGESEAFWVKRGLDTDDMYQGSPQPWDLDSTGYLWEHRLAWGAEDDNGERFEPWTGGRVDLYFWMHRAAPLGPVVVLHEAGFRASPVFEATS